MATSSQSIDRDEDEAVNKKLSDAQVARVERNRQRALLLRQARLSNQPYTTDKSSIGTKAKPLPKLIDTGAGFYIEEDQEERLEDKTKLQIKHPQGPVLAVDNLLCDGCDKEFMDSYLHTNFDVLVCDNCRRDNEDDHSMITKTECKTKYLLSDADISKREPPLKYIIRKNPHNQRWGEMHLYYEPQVYARAMEVWGSEEKIDEAKESRQQNREKAKQKKFDKKVKELRHAVRSSLTKKDLGPHEHVYGNETYNEEEDVYSKTCRTCGHVTSYEKM